MSDPKKTTIRPRQYWLNQGAMWGMWGGSCLQIAVTFVLEKKWIPFSVTLAVIGIIAYALILNFKLAILEEKEDLESLRGFKDDYKAAVQRLCSIYEKAEETGRVQITITDHKNVAFWEAVPPSLKDRITFKNLILSADKLKSGVWRLQTCFLYPGLGEYIDVFFDEEKEELKDCGTTTSLLMNLGRKPETAFFPNGIHNCRRINGDIVVQVKGGELDSYIIGLSAAVTAFYVENAGKSECPN